MRAIRWPRCGVPNAFARRSPWALPPSPPKGVLAARAASFPSPDGLRPAAEAGASAVIQPGGSMNDADVIKAADDAGLAMVFTGQRHFRH